ncbi:PTS sugar transporter subunit IIA [Lysobacter sp. A6]|uniref:PTS sugar transporter subunit IIA n=1 Tax=Noviluteimonas lactosilytica TaxID=2888523 RepID=A0ABS8JK36_9GAMM|nr:PTS sugar transporter subunit IIA [Lysobacter lactosilyticus]MCC8363970.1 PTS sugar transporter subunit IIA [Lysobacter lactosilyticus]
MPFQSLLAADRIVLLVEAGDRDGVLDAAARLLSDASPANTQAIAESLRKRERLGSTAIGHGIAIPHGRTNAFDHARAAFLRLRTPVDFGASDGEPVDLVFAMAVPEHFTQEHLQLLAQIAEHFADAGFREALRNARDVVALRALLLDPAQAPLAAGQAR